MRRTTFRNLIAICAIWAALSLPSLLAVAYATTKGDDARAFDFDMATLGFALLPVAGFGLWHERLWGFICLLLGLSCVLITHSTASYLHGFCLVVTLVRYFFPRDEVCTVRE